MPMAWRFANLNLPKARLSNVNGSLSMLEIFSCKVFGWCGNPVWAPGTGHPSYPDAWKDAWDQVGQCDPNYAPEVDLLSPSNGDRLTPNQPFDVVLTATDEDGDIEKVEVLLNGKVVASADGQQDVDA